ncbi:MAG: methyltransferase domain-containing protein, partial [Clostridia bacterium]|nr:methyltransferase domain-containing protein [Clostridia bacterium]
DAYCGTGTIGLIAARSAGHVIGVELNGDAVADAMENARLNEIKNAEFHKGDAGEFMTKTALAGNSIDVVIIDPPRSGASIEFLRSIVSLAPARIVYVSCNPETQARDVNYLSYRGYRVKKIQPVDMFPHTDHVESVVLIGRAKRTDNVKREEK